MLQTFPAALVACALDAKPGEAVLDMCAAPGGKVRTLAVTSRGLPPVPAQCRVLRAHTVSELEPRTCGPCTWQGGLKFASQCMALTSDREGASKANSCGGGQATHIAERMGGSGTVTACDRSAHKVDKIEQLARRLRLDTVLVLPPLVPSSCALPISSPYSEIFGSWRGARVPRVTRGGGRQPRRMPRVVSIRGSLPRPPSIKCCSTRPARR